MQYVYALNPVCIVLIIYGHSTREIPRQTCWTWLIRRSMTIHRTWHTLININVNFSSFIWVCLIFYTYVHRTSKSIGNNAMKEKMLLASAWPCLLQDVLNRRFTVQKQTAMAPKPSPIISSFLELGRRKLSMQPKFGGAESIVKTETQQTFVNGLLGFAGHLYSAELTTVCSQ